MKKIVIVTSLAPPSFGGTPTMLGRYLNIFPKNSYFFLTDNLTKDSPIVSKYLYCKYYFFDGSSVYGNNTKAIRRLNKKKHVSSYKKTSSYFRKIIYFFNYLQISIVDSYIFIYKIFRAYKVGVRIVKNEKPDSILAISDNGPALISSYLISKRTGIPYSIFLFDLYKGHLFYAARYLTAFLVEKIIIKNARKLFVAGEEIGKHYFKLYGKKSITIPNSINIPKNSLRVRPMRKKIKIVYTGAYYWAQKDAIEKFKDLVKQFPYIEFTIYSHEANELGHIGITQEESFDKQRKSDILLLPLSFGPTLFKSVLRTAPTGKISEYLISGVPILVFAPAYSWISRYLKKHRAAIVLNTNSEKKLKFVLAQMRNYSTRKLLVNNAFKLAKKTHDLKKNSKLLYNELQKVI